MSMMIAPHRFAVALPTSALNPADKAALMTLSNSNRTTTKTAGYWASVRSVTSHTSGLWYLEWTSNVAADAMIGFATGTASLNDYFGGSDGICYRAASPSWFGSGSAGVNTAAVNGDTTCVALDLSNRKMWVRRNGGIWNGNAANSPVTNVGGAALGAGMTGPIFAGIGLYGGGDQWTLNSGQAAFAQALPAGYLAWG